MQKARGHPLKGLPLLVGIRFQVLLHSPNRGSFHLSLTVLVHYRSSGSIYPWKMVLPDSDGISRVPPYSGTPLAGFDFAYEAVTRYGRTFQTVLLSTCGSIIGALQPRRVETRRFRLIRVRSPLLTESLLISFPSGTEMFHFPEFASARLCIQRGDNWT